ncbi:MAG TPA: PDZ domain-containing protein [Syntrophomonas sp.]|nr:PDZ domain-containing protein [Syntrophomonas sp.]
MELFIAVLLLMGKVFLSTFTSPLFIITYLLLFFIVCWQYRRLEDITQTLMNYSRNQYLRSALLSTALGLLGGLLGSILLIFIGIDLGHLGIMYLWVIAVLLMLVNPRFLCFAYAGGILSLISLATGYPDINIAQLMGLIAVLHMVESILIMLNGSFNPVPVYLRSGDNIRGGFNLQNFWPIPLIALVASGMADTSTGINMPDWWPLIKDYGQYDYGRNYTLLPVLAVLGYGEISSTSTPRQRVKKSGKNLFFFSLILLLLSILVSRWAQLTIIAALFSPLGHEFIIWLGMREETKRQPIYIKPPRGIMVLDVKTGSLASQAGIRSRDIILSVNGEPANNFYTLQELLSYGWITVELEVLREGKKTMQLLNCSPWQELGIIPVPEGFTPKYLSMDHDNIFDRLRRISGRLIRK